ncbi:hypothetical protein CHS0354_026276 [Potamilus streckersoni]|uniref:ATP synthase mitochondrial F1 complex assembly factor 1 n=1 Tax=Potamilus streckersoni TaxID=2493646 RepID=A0AAE0T2N3_9BIVA|nr:hypothetical protein CHS0354_026276 [Potamilus streckersoni]
MKNLQACFSCWRRLPISLTHKIQCHTFPSIPYSQKCGGRWCTVLRPFSTSKHLSDHEEKNKSDIMKNPYFDKYKEKLQQLEVSSREEYEAKVSAMEHRKIKQKVERSLGLSEPPPKIKGIGTPVQWPPQSLDEIMKIELMSDKTAEEIDKIWKEYHMTKDCIFGVIKESDYNGMMEKARICPTFIFPIPRNDGYEFILCQFYGKDVYFTPLGMFQLLKENAPPCLTLAHFPEFKEEKGIVLMAGQYDDKIITKAQALNLTKQLSIYYGMTAGERFNLVRIFNHLPEKFKHTDLIDEYKGMKPFFEDNQLV